MMQRSIFAGALFAILAVPFVSADCRKHRERHRSCRCDSDVKTAEKQLKNIRGTLLVENVQRDVDGNIASLELARVRGSGFDVQNIVLNQIDITPLLNGIGVSVLSALSFELQFDVRFERGTCKNHPTVVTGLEDALGALGSATAIVNSVVPVVNNVSSKGFTVNLFITLYGASRSAINDLLFAILTTQANVDFIAQCNCR